MLAFGRFSDIPRCDKLFAGASSVCVCSFSVCVCCLQAVQQLARHDHVTTPVMADGPLWSSSDITRCGLWKLSDGARSVCVSCLQAMEPLAGNHHVTTWVTADGSVQHRPLVSPPMLHDVEIV